MNLDDNQQIGNHLRRVIKTKNITTLIEWIVKRGVGKLSGHFRMLPAFIIIGAQRSGTTSLFMGLVQHPNVVPSYPKETHYFSNYYHKGVYWYRSHFPIIRNKRDNIIAGEATPYYIFHPHAPRRIFNTLPLTKFICILRNPIDRAYSHYQHEVILKIEQLTFEQAINKEDERMALDYQLLVMEKKPKCFNHQNYSYLSRGRYIEQLEIWKQLFDLNQILIIDFEEFCSNPPQIIQQAWEFLGVAKLQSCNLTIYNKTTYPPMKAETRQYLKNYFQPYNEQLFNFLGRDFGWNG